jgi:hypothetical protein
MAREVDVERADPVLERRQARRWVLNDPLEPPRIGCAGAGESHALKGLWHPDELRDNGLSLADWRCSDARDTARHIQLSDVSTPRRTGDRYQLDVAASWRQGRGAFGGLVIGSLIRAIEQHTRRRYGAEPGSPVLPRAGAGTPSFAAFDRVWAGLWQVRPDPQSGFCDVTEEMLSNAARHRVRPGVRHPRNALSSS